MGVIVKRLMCYIVLQVAQFPEQSQGRTTLMLLALYVKVLLVPVGPAQFDASFNCKLLIPTANLEQPLLFLVLYAQKLKHLNCYHLWSNFSTVSFQKIVDPKVWLRGKMMQFYAIMLDFTGEEDLC